MAVKMRKIGNPAVYAFWLYRETVRRDDEYWLTTGCKKVSRKQREARLAKMEAMKATKTTPFSG